MSVIDILIITAAILGVITIVGTIVLSEGRKNFFAPIVEHTQTRQR